MARASFRHEDAAKGGLRFQEGTIVIRKSFATNFQYPPNRTTNEQSDPFPAIVWQGVRVNSDNEPLEDQPVEIVQRVGELGKVRPGKLAPKDFDNMNVDPEDLGADVGVEGNALVVDDGVSLSRDWGRLDESMRKAGFKAEIAGRGITTDYEGTILHLKTVKGEKYIAKSGKKAGQEVEPTHLECDKILVYGYDVKKPSASASKGAASKSTSTSASGSNGHAKPGEAGEVGDAVLEMAKAVVLNLTDQFKSAIPAGKEVGFDVFEKALPMELMRQNGKPGENKGKLGPKVTKDIMAAFRNQSALMQIAMETEQFAVGQDEKDNLTVTFA